MHIWGADLLTSHRITYHGADVRMWAPRRGESTECRVSIISFACAPRYVADDVVCLPAGCLYPHKCYCASFACYSGFWKSMHDTPFLKKKFVEFRKNWKERVFCVFTMHSIYTVIDLVRNLRSQRVRPFRKKSDRPCLIRGGRKRVEHSALLPLTLRISITTNDSTSCRAIIHAFDPSLQRLLNFSECVNLYYEWSYALNKSMEFANESRK